MALSIIGIKGEFATKSAIDCLIFSMKAAIFSWADAFNIELYASSPTASAKAFWLPNFWRPICNCFCALSVSLAPILDNNSCFFNISPSWSLLIPNAFDRDSAWILFIFKKSLELPTWLVISAAAPAKSLFKKASLAFIKFMFLPVNSWASNSFDMLDSKSKKESAIESSCFNSRPIALTVTKDFVSLSGYFAKDNPK